MTNTVQSVENICNMALGKIGFERRIGDIYEGTRHSKLCLDFYAQTRDSLFRLNDWGFTERNINATLINQAPAGGYSPANPWTPAFPPPPWYYQYQYPSDCIKLRSIKSSQIFLPNFSPVPYVFDIVNDNSQVPAVKTILCNVQGAIFVYTAQITDMTAWEPSFVEALVDALAKKLAPGISEITQSGEAAEKEELQDEAIAETIAARMQG